MCLNQLEGLDKENATAAYSNMVRCCVCAVPVCVSVCVSVYVYLCAHVYMCMDVCLLYVVYTYMYIQTNKMIVIKKGSES